MKQKEMCSAYFKNVICLLYRTGKRLVRRSYWGVLCVDVRIILNLKLKELVLRVLTGSVWIRMLVTGRLCNRAVERMFFVSSECLDQLTDCDTVTQCCSALNCVSVWQAVQTDMTVFC
jgi:hypothetical protein